MNKIKIIRREVTKARKVHDNASLDTLRFVGVKRRHAILRSCRNNMDKKGFHTVEIARALRHEILVSIMYEQITGRLTLKKKYKNMEEI